MTEREKTIRDNYLSVLDKINKAVRARGDGGEVRLLAATKTVPAEEIVFAAKELGLRLAGENKVTEFSQKYDMVSPLLEYHFIGHLQTNKVKKIVGRASLIHSVDSVRLAEEINKEAEKQGIVQDILIEINSGREENKSGFFPEESEKAIEEIRSFSSLNVRGLMTMGPKTDSASELKKYFKETYSIYLDNIIKKSHNKTEGILSMGMSESYELAIEEGSTMIRIGSAIFGARDYGK